MKIVLISIFILTLVGCGGFNEHDTQPKYFIFLEYDDFDNCISTYIVNAKNNAIAMKIYDTEYFMESKGDRYECFEIDIIRITDRRKYLSFPE